MVTVSGYNVRKNKDGQEFIALELTGSLEIVQSQNSGKFYATVRRCNIPSSFNEATAKMMVGSQIEGEVVRVQSEPYEYTIKRTGEVVTLAYSYAYQPTGSKEFVGHGTVVIEDPALQEKAVDGIKKAAIEKRKQFTNSK